MPSNTPRSSVRTAKSRCVTCPPRSSLSPGREPPRNREARESHEREDFLRILRECGGNQSEVARRLGVSRVTVWKRIKKFGIDVKRTCE